METLTPQSIIEAEVTERTDEVAIPVHPLVRGIIGVGVNLAIDFSHEVFEPELTLQRGQPACNQQELLRDMAEIDYLQSEADLLHTQSPGHIMQSFFGTPEEIRADIEKMTTVRAELAEITSAPPQAPAVELQYTPHTVSTMDAGNL